VGFFELQSMSIGWPGQEKVAGLRNRKHSGIVVPGLVSLASGLNSSNSGAFWHAGREEEVVSGASRI
jgi:hypothetical protein